MDIKKALIQEHSAAQRDKIVVYVGNDKKRFEELIVLMLTAEYRVAQRAAWPVSYCVENHPELIKPWLQKIIIKLDDKSVHDAIRRNSLRILQEVNIPDNLCGELYNKCYKFLHDMNEPIAVRVFSLSVMANISSKHPELKGEVQHNAESLLHCGIPALESRGRIVLKELRKKTL